MVFSKFKKFSSKYPFLFWIPIFVILLLSIILTLSPAVKYRTLEIDLRWAHWFGFSMWVVCFFYLYRKINKSHNLRSILLLTSTELLIGIGLIVIWRLNNFFGFKQTLWMMLSTVIAGLIIDYPIILKKLKQFKYLLLITGIILIIFTFLFGTYPVGSGPRLWLGFSGIYFQPSELLKILLIIFLASYFSETPAGKFDLLQNLFPTFILAFAAFTLLVFQRDMGTALIFLSIYILMIFSVYGKRRILLISFLILAFVSLLGYQFVDLIRIRFQGWIYPWYSSQTSSYQIIQSIIAIAAGGLFGTGLGLGYPTLVPLSHSDFIFTAITEELGVLGAIVILLLFAIILFSGIKISIFAKNRYHRYLSIGFTCYILMQSILIIGGNIRLLPITGVTLPFMSYGGSSLLVSFIALSIILHIGDHTITETNVEQKPYRWIAAFFSLCLIATALTIGYWGIYNANDIQLRSDNPRNLIANIFVQRGSIFGRNNNILASSEGNPGEFERVYSYPELSNTLGYFSQKHGVAGVEKSFDAYLRGLKGYPTQKIWHSYLLYDQPPEGRSIRLTISLEIQQYVDDLLENKKGSIVLMNAESGDILALSSSPNFDANQLDSNWDKWHSDENAPLINRATQGAYPVGGLISPLLFPVSESENIFEDTSQLYYSIDNFDPICNRENQQNMDDAKLFQNGCYSTILNFAQGQDVYEALSSDLIRFILEPPDIGLTTAPGFQPDPDTNWIDAINGTNMIRSNPIQIATSFLPLSNGGYQISPTLTSAVNVSSGEWIIISNPKTQRLSSKVDLERTIDLLQNEDNNTWGISTISKDDNGTYSWYVTGSIFDEKSSNYVIAVVLEESTREEALLIGNTIMRFLQRR